MVILALVIAGICAGASVAVIHFGGGGPSPSMIENSGAHNVTITSVTLWVDYNVGSQSTKIRFGYSENSSATWQYTSWAEVLGSGRLSKPISGLTPNTCYEFKVFLQYDSSTLTSTVKTFETQPIPPTIENFEVTNIDETSAVLNISYDCGSYPDINIQFSYKEIDGGGETTGGENVSGSGVFSENISNLTPGMVYLVQTVIRYDNTLHPDNVQVFHTPLLPGQLSVPNFEAVGTETAVADGDTIYVSLTWVKRSTTGVEAGSYETVRFAGGIDAPEDPGEECGPEATEYVANLSPRGTEVLLDLDNRAIYGAGPFRDIYGRLLAVIYIRKENTWVNINAQELKWGMEACPSNNWDEYASMPSEFSLYEWPPYDNDYPYVLDCPLAP